MKHLDVYVPDHDDIVKIAERYIRRYGYDIDIVPYNTVVERICNLMCAFFPKLSPLAYFLVCYPNLLDQANEQSISTMVSDVASVLKGFRVV